MRTDCWLGRYSKLWSLLATVVFAGVCFAQSPEPLPVETIRVDANLVDLKVSVIGPNSGISNLALQQKDFLVFEDGKPQDISFFAAADAPFDLILLLDISGSTADKMKLIRRSAKRFVDATRPGDRVGVVTFTDVPELVSDLTLDRVKLKKTIDGMEKTAGGTKFWDALRDVIISLVRARPSSRRTAIVVMTDGIDNALPGIFGEGSSTLFPELLHLVMESDAIVFPIFLDTEKEESKRHGTPHDAYVTARQQLALLAETCGTTMYRAAKIEDLETVYEGVIKDLGTVYSIGYRPSNIVRDGKWRTVEVRLNEHPELAARSRRGYYAKPIIQP